MRDLAARPRATRAATARARARLLGGDAQLPVGLGAARRQARQQQVGPDAGRGGAAGRRRDVCAQRSHQRLRVAQACRGIAT